MPATGSITWEQLQAASDQARRQEPCLDEHAPVAAVLTCSDARVSPARLFDLPEGSLFVVRVAGNIATPEAVASLAYAVEQLEVETIVVLGHSHCGAVAAAIDGDDHPELACLVDPIRTAITAAPGCDEVPCAVERNVAATVVALASDHGPLGAALRSGRARVHGAIFDLETATVTDLPVATTADLPVATTADLPVATTRSLTP